MGNAVKQYADKLTGRVSIAARIRDVGNRKDMRDEGGDVYSLTGMRGLFAGDFYFMRELNSDKFKTISPEELERSYIPVDEDGHTYVKSLLKTREIKAVLELVRELAKEKTPDAEKFMGIVGSKPTRAWNDVDIHNATVAALNYQSDACE